MSINPSHSGILYPEARPAVVDYFPSHKISPLSLYRFCGRLDKVILVVGTLSAASVGATLPLMCVIVGEAINGFSPLNTMDEILATVSSRALWMLYIGLASFVLSILSESSWVAIGERLGVKVRSLYLNALMRKEVAWFDMNHPQELTTKISSLITKYQSGIGEKAGKVIMSLSMFISGVTVAFIYGWQLALILMAVYPLTLVAARYAGIANSASAENMRKGYAKCGGYAEEALSAIKTVCAFCAQQFEKHRYLTELVTAEKATIRNSIYLGAAIGLINFAIAFTQGLGYFIGSFFIEYEVYNTKYKTPYTCASVLTVFFSGLFSMFSLGTIAPQLKSVEDAQLSANEIYSMIESEPEATSIPKEIVLKPPLSGVRIPSEHFKGRIVFRNVTFCYPSKPDVKVLDNLTTVFEPGCMIGICGETGSGKSTIIQLVERFYKPRSGAIEIDGIDLNQLDIKWWRSMVGYVGQEPVLFNTTIGQNIAYGNPNAEQKDILWAAKQANALEFIENLEHGINTQTGSGGGQLSGGQKQRVAIARALVKAPQVLLLDEATSALDVKSEYKFQKAIFELQKDRRLTCIAVAHRLSTIKSADRILVLNGGVIAEVGTDSELRALSGIYANLCRLQDGEETEELSGEESKSGQPTTANRPSSTTVASVIPKQDSRVLVASSTRSSLQSNASSSPQRKDSVVSRYRRQIWAANWKYKYQMIFAILLSLTAGYNMPVSGTLFGMVTSDLLIPFKDQMRKRVNMDFVGFILIGFFIFFISLGMFWLFGYVAAKVTYRLRKELYDHMLNMDVGWFDQPENLPFNLGAILAEGTENINGMVRMIACSLIQSASALIIALGIGFAYSYRMSAIILGCVPIMALCGIVQTRFQIQYARQSQILYKPSMEILSEAVRNFRTVASFCNEERVGRLYLEALQPALRKGQTAALISGVIYGFGQLLPFAVYAMLFYLAALFLVKYEDPPRNTFIAAYSLMFAAIALGQVQGYAPDMGKAYASLFSVYGVIDQKPKIVSPPERPVETEIKGKIEFQNVSFHYPNRSDYVLRDFSMTINAGQKITLVGASGSGKSTIVQLLERFYDVDAGRILIDGVDIRNYSLAHLRKSIGYVPQEPYLFDATIGDNVRYGTPDARDEEVKDACRAANALEFIERDDQPIPVPDENRIPMFTESQPTSERMLGKGFERKVGAKGSLLSGGQKQRLAIARAVIRCPKILLLDEATSALDSETEATLQKLLSHKLHHRTVVSVAHRLGALEEDDVIFVLDNGTLVETGRKRELMARKGSFYRLYAPAAGGSSVLV